MIKINLNENAESRSQHKAIQLVMQKLNIDKEHAEKLVRNDVRRTFKILQGNKKLGKFTFGVTRLWFDNLCSISNKEKIMDFLVVVNHNEEMYKELDDNFNGKSINELMSQYKKEIDYFFHERESEELAGLTNTGEDNEYTVVRIESFEQAERFNNYVDWCITYSKHYYKDYTEDGNVFYFLLRNGFTRENPDDYIPAKNDDGYALSMIAVSVEMGTSNIKTCNTRRNRQLVGHDHQLDWVDISKMIGHNIKEMIAHEEEGRYNPFNFKQYMIYHKSEDMFEFTDNVDKQDIDAILKQINDAFYRHEVLNNKENHESIIKLHKGKYVAFSQLMTSCINRNHEYMDLMGDAITKFYYNKIENLCRKLVKALLNLEVWSADYDLETETRNDNTSFGISKIVFTLSCYGKEYDSYDGDGEEVDIDDEIEFDNKYLKRIVKALVKKSGVLGDWDESNSRNSDAEFKFLIYEDVDDESYLNTKDTVQLLKKLVTYVDSGEITNDIGL